MGGQVRPPRRPCGVRGRAAAADRHGRAPVDPGGPPRRGAAARLPAVGERVAGQPDPPDGRAGAGRPVPDTRLLLPVPGDDPPSPADAALVRLPDLPRPGDVRAVAGARRHRPRRRGRDVRRPRLLVRQPRRGAARAVSGHPRRARRRLRPGAAAGEPELRRRVPEPGRHGVRRLHVRDDSAARPPGRAAQPVHVDPRRDRRRPARAAARAARADRGPGLLARRGRRAVPGQLARRPRAGVGQRRAGSVAQRGRAARSGGAARGRAGRRGQPAAEGAAGGAGRAAAEAAGPAEPEPVPERPSSRKRKRKRG